jgi:carnitine O-acetyltransferase
MAEAVQGKGVDRHLLGLKMILKPEEKVPGLYTDPSYSMTSHWALSTSQISSDFYDGYGWGEVVPDGFGIAYMVNSRSLHFNLVSMRLGGDRLRHFLIESLNEMREVFSATLPKESAPAKAKL